MKTITGQVFRRNKLYIKTINYGATQRFVTYTKPNHSKREYIFQIKFRPAHLSNIRYKDSTIIGLTW